MNIYQRFDLDLEILAFQDEKEKAEYNPKAWHRMVSILNGRDYTVLRTKEKDFRGFPVSIIVQGTANKTVGELSEKIRDDFYKAAKEVGLKRFETSYSYSMETRFKGEHEVLRTYKTEDVFGHKKDEAPRRGVIPLFPKKEEK